jgi:hypothetical protein
MRNFLFFVYAFRVHFALFLVIKIGLKFKNILTFTLWHL